jgi:hypothetical protein
MSIVRAGQEPDSAPGTLPGDAVELAYRTGPLLADYGRAAGGLALALAPLLLLQPPWPVQLGLVGLAVLFAAFLVQTWRRQHSRLLLTPAGVALVGPHEGRIAWAELDGLRLRWFGSRRPGGSGGWLELELRGGGQRIVVTSALRRFEDVLADAVDAAERNRLPLEPATRTNIAAVLGRAA